MAYPGMMKQVAVFVKHGGVLAACPVFPTPDGCFWRCLHCSTVLMRASFGVLSGLWRCECGVDTELFIDGQSIDIEGMSEANAPIRCDVPAAWQLKDEDFLRECGISASATEEEPC